MDLDQEQTRVVEYEDSQVILAGPGSGKTRVLTEKARRIFNSGQSLVCLCFTRAAAREMAERVPGLPCSTIHSYCCGRVGWNKLWGYPGLLYRFLQQGSDDEYDYILVDEVQDLNPEEMDVVLSLVRYKIFAVGDPYQSIYGFQGAMGPEAISLLKKAGCKEQVLHNNYRSTNSIVDSLNRIYSRNLISTGTKFTGITFILTRTNDDLFLVSRELKSKGVPHRVRLSTAHNTSENREYDVIQESTLRLMTIHQSKGLEADRVLLYNWLPEDWMGEEEKRVFYVAVSRASKDFLWVPDITELLKEVQ